MQICQNLFSEKKNKKNQLSSSEILPSMLTGNPKYHHENMPI